MPGMWILSLVGETKIPCFEGAVKSAQGNKDPAQAKKKDLSGKGARKP